MAAAAAAGAPPEAPQHWAQADKDMFAALPAEARAPFLTLCKRMEAGFTKKLTRAAQLERDFRVFAEKGYSTPGIINAWVELAVRLEIAEQAEANDEQFAAGQQQIENFANEVDDNGRLAHPFYREVEAEMTGLAELDRAMGKAPDLADLYHRAVSVNPTVREKQLALQRARRPPTSGASGPRY